ncbi:MAG: DHH family phosphoesterase [Chitinophagales bacterium]
MATIDLNPVASVLQTYSQWTVVGHNIPDGDCIGAVIGLQNTLKQMGKDITSVIEEGVPSMYQFLDGWEHISTFQNPGLIHKNIIYVDCSDRQRVGEKLTTLLESAEFVVNIDHHVSNQKFGNINLVDEYASSTCELLFNLIKLLNISIGHEIATPLYCGIVMDSGRFQYSATRPETLETAAELLRSGVNLDLVRGRLFESKSKLEMTVTSAALETLSFSEDNRLAWMWLSNSVLSKLGAIGKHFEGIIDFARNVEGVEVAVLFREIEPGKIKIGIRSKGTIDANQAAALWGGGGHRRAAGAMLTGEIKDVIEQVTGRFKDELL